MIRKIGLFIILSVSFCYGRPMQWMVEQIGEDLPYLSHHPVTRQELKNEFEKLSNEGRQALYYKIRRNAFILRKKTKETDEIRNLALTRYFDSLGNHHSLPDTDFILVTEDGLSESTKIPLFAFAKAKEAVNVFLFPDFEMMSEVVDRKKSWIRRCSEYSLQYPWELKIEKAFFRGGSTGGVNLSLPDLGNDRFRVVLFSAAYPELLDATFSQLVLTEFQEKFNLLNKPLETIFIPQHFQFKYLLDVDGHSCTYSRCRWILLSNSTLLKLNSRNIQWYYKALQPWIHFVPISQDLSDLREHIEFLRSHDSVARSIADQGKELGEIIFSRKKVDEYIVYLLHSYAKYVSLDKK